MHRYIIGVNGAGVVVDHINGDTHDNRKANLRTCTPKENSWNAIESKNCTSGHVGIRITPSGKFSARIMVDRKEIFLGTFQTMDEAIKARNEAEDKYRGEFAPHRCRKTEKH